MLRPNTLCSPFVKLNLSVCIILEATIVMEQGHCVMTFEIADELFRMLSIGNILQPSTGLIL